MLLLCDVMAEYSAHMKSVTQDVIKKLPSRPLRVSVVYRSSGATVGFGNKLTPSEVTEVPEVSYEADPDSLYTLIKTDPDAPSRDMPLFREFIHWVVVNIPGNQVNKGNTVAKYETDTDAYH